ncbi:hypothetical protein [Pontibacter arcticus]|uniref:Uncharacterized protein n=1 Tax=Pontibacter arcticus TaxID=2080288 RepID=A0A364RH87_9BACT|nr:hypothetical protein [Pontibacter arcticus]RAU83700.1 hypothetical protein DP923_01095 [Pontibacter arcticus]
MQTPSEQALSHILNLPLTKTTRNELVQYFHFGHTHYTTPQGLILDVGAYTLAVNCPWQLAHPQGDAIKHSEVFMRKREAGMPALKWDWKVPGANLRDQRLKDLLNEGAALVVERVEQTENGGFILYFANHYQLAVSPDPEKAATEVWQLFSNLNDGFAYSPTH